MEQMTKTAHLTTAGASTSAPASPTGHSRQTGPGARRALGAILGAAALAAAVWTLAVPVLGVQLSAAAYPGGPAGARTITLGAVAGSAVLSGLLGWGLLATLTRWTRRGRRIWTWVAVVLTVLSLLSPLTLADSASAAFTLCLLHLAVAGAVVPGFVGRISTPPVR